MDPEFFSPLEVISERDISKYILTSHFLLCIVISPHLCLGVAKSRFSACLVHVISVRGVYKSLLSGIRIIIILFRNRK
jgi:hypothetical protein